MHKVTLKPFLELGPVKISGGRGDGDGGGLLKKNPGSEFVAVKIYE